MHPSREESFFSFVNYSNDCWEWTGTLTYRKQGRFWDGSRMVLAYRWAYEYFISSISPGKFICHHCDNPKCVNPFHLFEGTNSDNMRDCVEKGRHVTSKPGYVHPNTKKTECKRGHVFTAANTYREPNGYRRCRACARELEEKRALAAFDKLAGGES